MNTPLQIATPILIQWLYLLKYKGTSIIELFQVAAPAPTTRGGENAEGVEVVLNPDELDMDTAAMQAKYDQQVREQQSQLEKEDLSDMVADHAAKQAKVSVLKYHVTKQAKGSVQKEYLSDMVADHAIKKAKVLQVFNKRTSVIRWLTM